MNKFVTMHFYPQMQPSFLTTMHLFEI